MGSYYPESKVETNGFEEFFFFKDYLRLLKANKLDVNKENRVLIAIPIIMGNGKGNQEGDKYSGNIYRSDK